MRIHGNRVRQAKMESQGLSFHYLNGYQLSYLFKPRKRKQGSRKPPPVTHKIELQALAIREKKIYLQELLALSRQPVELFLDMEGVPDRGRYYLMGLLVCQGDITKHHVFWADTDQD